MKSRTSLLARLLTTVSVYVLCRYIHVVAFALYSFWIPQIVSCVKNDARQPLRPAYIIGISITRLALPLYLYGCPKNLLEEPPSLRMCFGLCLFVAAQVRPCASIVHLADDSRRLMSSSALYLPVCKGFCFSVAAQ